MFLISRISTSVSLLPCRLWCSHVSDIVHYGEERSNLWQVIFQCVFSYAMAFFLTLTHTKYFLDPLRERVEEETFVRVKTRWHLSQNGFLYYFSAGLVCSINDS